MGNRSPLSLFPISKNDFQGTKLGKSVDRNAVCVHNRIMEKKSITACCLQQKTFEFKTLLGVIEIGTNNMSSARFCQRKPYT
jgi:hypothetical protein